MGIARAVEVLEYCYENQDLSSEHIDPPWKWSEAIEDIYLHYEETNTLTREQVRILSLVNVDTLDENINRTNQYRREMDRD